MRLDLLRVKDMLDIVPVVIEIPGNHRKAMAGKGIGFRAHERNAVSLFQTILYAIHATEESRSSDGLLEVDLAIDNGKDEVAIISGIGSRNYYRKFGYEKVGPYMMKKLI